VRGERKRGERRGLLPPVEAAVWLPRQRGDGRGGKGFRGRGFGCSGCGGGRRERERRRGAFGFVGLRSGGLCRRSLRDLLRIRRIGRHDRRRRRLWASRGDEAKATEGGRWRGRRVGSEGKCRQAGRREEGLERAGEGVGRTAQELFTAVSSLDPFLFRFVS
jgi:hypothetical protein